MEKLKMPVKTELVVRKNRNEVIRFSMDEVLEKLGIDEIPDEVGITVHKDECSITTYTEPKDEDYPSICTDGIDSLGNTLYLSVVELPNDACKDSICSYMYAGNAEYESDSPVAAVKTMVTDKDYIRKHIKDAEDCDYPTKLVYIDTDLFSYKDPHAPINEVPEHVGEKYNISQA